MGTAERRLAIYKLLCRRRHETIENIASEFAVSERTVRRDIEILSLSEPIYTVAGRYGGGVYVVEDYYSDNLYITQEEEQVLGSIYEFLDKIDAQKTMEKEITILKKIITKYSKPKLNKEKKYE